MSRRSVRYLLVTLPGLLALGGCEKLVQNMYDQPKYETFESSSLWGDGASARQTPPGALAAEDADPSGSRPAIDRRLIARGQERYNIWCAPCHSIAGDGDGMVPLRGFPHPPSFHNDRLRQTGDQHFYDVISNGYGVMYPYGPRVPPPDRWAIVAYIRALQLSQHAHLEDVPEAERPKLEGRS